MSDDMGTFTVTCAVESPLRRGILRQVENVLVDSGSELSWLPSPVLEELGIQHEKRFQRFVMANGGVLARYIGFAIIHVGEYFTVDEVVFGEPGELAILGARSLEGMNVRVDVANKRLVAAGPILAALAA